MIKIPKNRHILVVGGDHHNTLASLRSLGRAGVHFDLLLHSKKKKLDELIAASSRYCPDGCTLVDDTCDAVSKGYQHWLVGKDPHDCIVLTSSDLAAYVADRELAAVGVVTSSFQGEAGRAARLMDKYEQYLWATSHGIPMARSIVVTDGERSAENLHFPLILKPLVSAFGEKTDIAIVDTHKAYDEACQNLFTNGYKRLLVQEVVDFDYEMVACGCIFLSSGKEAHITLKKEVTFPRKAGNVAIGHAEQVPEIERLLREVTNALSGEGFRGMFDIEVFATAQGPVLNEINFRQSGNMFACLDNGMSLPLFWVGDASGGSIVLPETEAGWLRIVAEPQLVSGLTHGQISAGSAIASVLRADSFAIYAKDDTSPLRKFLFGGIVAKISKVLLKKGH